MTIALRQHDNQPKSLQNAIKWSRLSCRRFHNNAVGQQPLALSYNLVNFMRTLALAEELEHRSLLAKSRQHYDLVIVGGTSKAAGGR